VNGRARQAITRLRDFGPDRILLIASALFIFLIVVQGARFGFASRLGKGLIDSLTAREAKPIERKDVKSLEDYKPITDKGILGAPPGKPPQQKLFGIMGDMALIGASPDDSKTYSLGAEIPGGEKLVEIGGDYVMLEKDGNQRKELVFPAKGGEGRVVELPGGMPSGPPGGQPRPEQPPQPQRQQMPAQPTVDQEQMMRMKMEQAKMQAEQARMEAERAAEQQPRQRTRR